jgi:hypothetical protein
MTQCHTVCRHEACCVGSSRIYHHSQGFVDRAPRTRDSRFSESGKLRVKSQVLVENQVTIQILMTKNSKNAVHTRINCFRWRLAEFTSAKLVVILIKSNEIKAAPFYVLVYVRILCNVT